MLALPKKVLSKISSAIHSQVGHTGTDLSNGGYGEHLGNFASNADDFESNMCTLFNDLITIVRKLRRRGVPVIFDIRRDHLKLLSTKNKHSLVVPTADEINTWSGPTSTKKPFGRTDVTTPSSYETR